VSSGDAVFRRIQSIARSTAAKSGTGAPTQEYLIRHTLESFLDRLTRTSHADDFVLKGGVLLAAYGVRRPTKDADANASAPTSPPSTSPTLSGTDQSRVQGRAITGWTYKPRRGWRTGGQALGGAEPTG
jgi:hypothetical protein